MDKTTIGISAVMAFIVSFAVVTVFDEKGELLEPTHYCESRELQMHCARTTAQYCYPVDEALVGRKRCIEGWKYIPEVIEEPQQKYNLRSGTGSSHCTNLDCF